jgi:AcrR family transcriptional regulator
MAASQIDNRDPEDLTGRARIRDAALSLFAERGIEATTIRDIAKQAGVSSGLVRHHFGSKDALRDACDTYALEWLTRAGEQALAEGRISEPGLLGSVHPTVMLMQNYLLRSAMDGSERAAKTFDEMVTLGEEWLAYYGKKPADPRAFSAVLCAMKMGAFLLRDQVSRALGVDVRTPAGHARMIRGFVDVFAEPLITSEQAAHARAAVDRLEGNRPAPVPGAPPKPKERDEDDRGDSH